MGYGAAFFISILLWLAAVVYTIAGRFANKGRSIAAKPYLLFAGTFLAAAVLFLPIYAEYFGGGITNGIKTILISVHNALRMFVLDGEFDIIENSSKALSPSMGLPFSLWAAFLYVLAPVLTFSFVLSFFKNIAAYRRYLFQYFREAHIFSELNERSLVLTESIRQKYPKAAIVFTDVFSGDNEASNDMIEKAHRMRAVCFKHDITHASIRKHSKTAAMSFYLLGENKTEEIEHTATLIHAFQSRENTKLYVFSPLLETELLTFSALRGQAAIKVFRIDEVQALVYQCLYEHSIFKNALPSRNGKTISIVILRLGRYGTEMLKALCWCGQMNGYRLIINVFDKNENAQSRFTAACPELLAHNDDPAQDEAHYAIHFHNGVDYQTPAFAELLLKISPATFVFVSAGNDEINMDAALYLRMLFERMNCRPDILTVVYSTVKADLVKQNGLVNFKNQDYNIKVIGDLASRYSYNAIANSALEKEALKHHLRWGDERRCGVWAYWAASCPTPPI
jgi:hypothetical protein